MPRTKASKELTTDQFMALQAISMNPRLPKGPITAEDAVGTIQIAFPWTESTAKRLVLELSQNGALIQSNEGLRISQLGQESLQNPYRIPISQTIRTQENMINVILGRLQSLGWQISQVDQKTKATDNLLADIRRLEVDIGTIKSDYMRKDFWYTVVYPIVVATIPAAVVGLIFYIITVFGPHPA